jgi:hypothetical protein
LAAVFKQFESNKLSLRYFPDNKVILLIPKKNTSPHDLNLIKNKIETLLQVDSVKQESGGLSLKLSKETTSSAEELIRSLGFQGGADVGDAGTIAQQAAQNDLEQEQANTSLQPQQQIANQTINNNAPNEQPQIQQESLNIIQNLFEAFWRPHKKKGKVKAAKRTAEYWERLEKTSGKDRAKINEKDVLSMRSETSKKPFSRERNRTLIALDKAYKYFLTRIEREKGQWAKEKFKNDYYAKGNISPEEYSGHQKIDSDVFSAIDNKEDLGIMPGNLVNFLDIEDDKGEPGITYDDIDIENTDKIPTL